VQFEQRMVSDGNGGLCTSHRVSPYLIAAAGLSAGNLAATVQPSLAQDANNITLPAFNTVGDWKAA
jgi:hypothetical protein